MLNENNPFKGFQFVFSQEFKTPGATNTCLLVTGQLFLINRTRNAGL